MPPSAENNGLVVALGPSKRAADQTVDGPSFLPDHLKSFFRSPSFEGNAVEPQSCNKAKAKTLGLRIIPYVEGLLQASSRIP